MLVARLVGMLNGSRLWLAVAAITGTLCLMSAAALAATVRGITSQHGVVRADIAKGNRLIGLIIELKTSCPGHKRRDVWSGFEAPFRHGPDATGKISDSYDILGRDAATGARFRQRASFTGRISRRALRGSATVTQTLIATGVVCRSPKVAFTVHIT